MLNQLIHKLLSRLYVLLSGLNRPVKIQRTKQELKGLEKETFNMALYDYKWCVSSLKVRHEIHHLNIEIERRDIQNCPIHQDYLLAELGELKAPCLRVEENGSVIWLDEPEKIVHYLHGRFGLSSARLPA